MYWPQNVFINSTVLCNLLIWPARTCLHTKQTKSSETCAEASQSWRSIVVVSGGWTPLNRLLQKWWNRLTAAEVRDNMQTEEVKEQSFISIQRSKIYWCFSEFLNLPIPAAERSRTCTEVLGPPIVLLNEHQPDLFSDCFSVLHTEERFDRLGNGKNECFTHRRTLWQAGKWKN